MGKLHEDLFHAFVVELSEFRASARRVYDRLRAERGLSAVVVDRLLGLKSKPPEACAEDVLTALGCDGRAWHEYWLKEDGARFIAVLDRLPEGSPLAHRVWTDLIAVVKPDTFADPEQSAIGSLAAISGQFPKSLTREQKERLDAWSAINLAFASPPKTQAAGEARTLASACREVGATREDLAEQWFKRHVLTGAKTRRNEGQGGEVRPDRCSAITSHQNPAFTQGLKLANNIKNETLRGECKTEIFTAVVPNEKRDDFAGSYEGELIETSIRPGPKVDLLQRAKEKTTAAKSVASGSRLSRPDASSIWPFVGGIACTLLLLALLFPFISSASGRISTWWHADEIAKAAEAGKKEEEERRAELTRLETKIGSLQGETKEKDSRINEIELKLRDTKKLLEAANQARPAQITPPAANNGSTSPPPKPEEARDVKTNDSEMINRLFKAIVVERPLSETREFALAVEYAKELQKRGSEGRLGSSFSLESKIS